jgi:hypothetical protein
MKTTSAFLIISIAIAAASCASGPTKGRPPQAGRSAATDTAAAALAIRSAPTARDYMADLIMAKKLVFLSETHVTVDPILFLAENLRGFYDAGLRYLFTEGLPPGFRAAGRTDSRYEEPYFIYFLPPWASGGWKYEEGILSDAIRELNAGLPYGERLRLINAESGHDESGLADTDLLDSRDAYAFETISQVMDGAGEGAKGLIFYGASHGQKEAGAWTTMGGLLAARYGSSFASVDYGYLDDAFSDRVLGSMRVDRDREIPIALESGASKAFRGLGSRIGSYDSFILDLGPKTYGVCYQYVQTKANLVAMFTALRDFELSPRRDALLSMPVYRTEYFLLVYYLGLYYGDRFDYDLWSPEGRLRDALSGIEPIFLGPGADPVGALEVRAPESLSLLEEYHKLIIEPATGRFGVDAARSFEKAASMFPEDLWPSYGLATALMEKGDYDGALALLESILEKRLSRRMDMLPDMYDRAAECARILGMEDKAEEFRRARAALVNEHGLEPLSWRR